MKRKNRFHVLLLVVFLLLIVAKIVNGQSQNWSILNYSRERTSWVSNEAVLYPPLEQVNEYALQLSGTILEYITLHNNLLCASGQSGQYTPNVVEAIDIESGDTLWTFPVPGTSGGMGFTCAQNDSTVFVGGQHGLGLYALDWNTGLPKWNKPVGALYSRNIILDGNYAYFYSTDSIFCIHIHDGTTSWSKHGGVQGTPAVDDNYVYALGNYKIRIYDKSTGELLWEKINSQRTSPGIAVDDFCFYTFSNDTIFAYEKDSRNIKWFNIYPGVTIQRNAENTFAVSDSVLCFNIRNNGEGNGQLVALEKETGDSLWLHTFEGEYMYAPVIANGVVYVIPSKERSIYGFHLRTGEQLFYDNSSEYKNQPIVANHKLLAITSSNIVVFGNMETAITDDSKSTPDGFNLEQNYPNPFNPCTEIRYSIHEQNHVMLTVRNIQGKLIRSLISDTIPAGTFSVSWDGCDDFNNQVSSGIYLINLKTRQYTTTKKALLIR